MTETIQTRFFTKFKANIFISIKSEVFEAFVEKRIWFQILNFRLKVIFQQF